MKRGLAVGMAALGFLACHRVPTTEGQAPREPFAALRLDNLGYRPGDAKVAVSATDPGPVIEVRRGASEEPVLQVIASDGLVRAKGQDAASGDDVWWVDVSALSAPGTYYVWSPSRRLRSYDFVVGDDVYRGALRAALKTFYWQRCGVAKAKANALDWADERPCHTGDTSTLAARGHKDRGPKDLAGGWHDAGDYNKYVWYSVSNAILYLLRAWEAAPELFPDGFLDIPEAGNGVSDLLDEVKWELDYLLKMQLPDGSVLSRVHAAGDANGKAPPSTDDAPRFYEDPTVDGGGVFTGSCALASRVFTRAGQGAYGARLKAAALAGWTWLVAQPAHPEEKLWAAAEVFRLDPTVESARSYLERGRDWSKAGLSAGHYAAHAAVTHLRTPEAGRDLAAALRVQIGLEVDRLFHADDLYRNGMPATSYHWGSNSKRAAAGVLLLDAADLAATGSHTAAQCRAHALDLLHFFHGQNALGMLYLTNMASLGGEHSSWQVFHHWFGQSQSAYSRARYAGKPARIPEPDYPYFAGSDNHGVRDDKASSHGPPPGFVPGGPNRDYSGDARPPAGAGAPGRFYRDWNDQRSWTARTWEITETSIGYQGPYVALVAAFVER